MLQWRRTTQASSLCCRWANNFRRRASISRKSLSNALGKLFAPGVELRFHRKVVEGCTTTHSQCALHISDDLLTREFRHGRPGTLRNVIDRRLTTNLWRVS